MLINRLLRTHPVEELWSINNTPRSGAMLKTYFLHTNPAEEFLKKKHTIVF